MNLYYPSRKRKKYPTADSEVIRAATPTTGLRRGLPTPKVQRIGPLLNKAISVVSIKLKECLWWWCHTPLGPEGRAWNQKDYYWALMSNGICLLGFELVRDLSPFWFLVSEWECLSHHCILEASNLAGFTDSWLERNFAPGWIVPRSYSNLI